MSYKPSPRSGFPGSQKPSGSGDEWLLYITSGFSFIVGAIGGIHSLSVGFDWWPQGLMFVGGVLGFYSIVWFKGDDESPKGCIALSCVTSAVFGIIGLIVRGGWSPWGWIIVGSVVAFFVTAGLSSNSK
jgi:hypothetical protein